MAKIEAYIDFGEDESIEVDVLCQGIFPIPDLFFTML
jgi:hypothetical protein